MCARRSRWISAQVSCLFCHDHSLPFYLSKSGSARVFSTFSRALRAVFRSTFWEGEGKIRKFHGDHRHPILGKLRPQETVAVRLEPALDLPALVAVQVQGAVEHLAAARSSMQQSTISPPWQAVRMVGMASAGEKGRCRTRRRCPARHHRRPIGSPVRPGQDGARQVLRLLHRHHAAAAFNGQVNGVPVHPLAVVGGDLRLAVQPDMVRYTDWAASNLPLVLLPPPVQPVSRRALVAANNSRLRRHVFMELPLKQRYSSSLSTAGMPSNITLLAVIPRRPYCSAI